MWLRVEKWKRNLGVPGPRESSFGAGPTKKSVVGELPVQVEREGGEDGDGRRPDLGW